MEDEMDDKLNALEELIEAVETGEISKGVTGLKAFEQFSRNAFGLYQSNAAWRAYHGSLDAALALHEALLPNSGWKVCKLLCESTYTVEVWGEYAYSEASGTAHNPARAWLIAVLKAYREITQ